MRGWRKTEAVRSKRETEVVKQNDAKKSDGRCAIVYGFESPPFVSSKTNM